MDDLTHALTAIDVADNPEAWAHAGFTVDGNQVQIDHVVITLTGAPGTSDGDIPRRGITGLSILGLTGDMDGLPVAAQPAALQDGPAPTHPNGVEVFDHLVVMTPDPDRTTAAFEAAGLEARRSRVFGKPDAKTRQTFFWLGRVILELVGPDQPVDPADKPASPWGLALVTPDLDTSAEMLAENCSTPKEAVQPGRRIATVKTRDLDITVPIALMTPHDRR